MGDVGHKIKPLLNTAFSHIQSGTNIPGEFHRNIDYTGINDMYFLLNNIRNLHLVHITWGCRKEL
jgi:hypothetical protein